MPFGGTRWNLAYGLKPAPPVVGQVRRQAVDTNVPVLVGLLNDFTPGTPCAHDTVMKGKPDIGVVFFEIPNSTPQRWNVLGDIP